MADVPGVEGATKSLEVPGTLELPGALEVVGMLGTPDALGTVGTLGIVGTFETVGTLGTTGTPDMDKVPEVAGNDGLADMEVSPEDGLGKTELTTGGSRERVLVGSFAVDDPGRLLDTISELVEGSCDVSGGPCVGVLDGVACELGVGSSGMMIKVVGFEAKVVEPEVSGGGWGRAIELVNDGTDGGTCEGSDDGLGTAIEVTTEDGMGDDSGSGAIELPGGGAPPLLQC